MTRKNNVTLSKQSGFLYGDALMAVTLVLLLLPTILYVLSDTLTMVKTAYIDDYILQDTVSYIEEGKALYDSGGTPHITATPVSGNHNLPHIVFKKSLVEEEINGISILRYCVQAIDNGDVVYEISTFLGPPHH